MISICCINLALDRANAQSTLQKEKRGALPPHGALLRCVYLDFENIWYRKTRLSDPRPTIGTETDLLVYIMHLAIDIL